MAGYTVKATDGDIGDIEDFLIDENTMKIDFTVVDTGSWFPGKKVLLSPKWIREINWENSEVVINATMEQVRESPEYDADKPLSDLYTESLENYYGGFMSSGENARQ